MSGARDGQSFFLYSLVLKDRIGDVGDLSVNILTGE